MQKSLPNASNLQSESVRLQIEPGFTWDAQDAYLFDIDGTLSRNRDRVHMNSFVPSILQATGCEVSLDGVPIHGSTDTAILTAACEQAGIPREVLEPQWEAILESMRQRVTEQRNEMEIRRMPGVEAVLRHLAGKNALLGLATGNLEAIGWIKLEAVGLREWFRFGGFSDRFAVRSEMVADAAHQAREIAGPEASICVVGDTPRDIEAAHANSLPVIAVATGHYGYDALVEHKPELCVSSLADLLAWTDAQNAAANSGVAQ